MKINRLICFYILILLISCTKETRNNEITVHPIKEKIPHSDVEAEMLEVLDGGEYLDLLPENVQLLYRFLNDDTGIDDARELDLLTTNRLDIAAVNDSTLLILEKDKNHLIQYNIKSDEYEVIANQGRGPGDLLFAHELSVYQNKAAIGMGLFQISVFTCDVGLCEYEKTIITEYNNYSLDLGEEHIYYLGVARFGYEDYPDPANTNQNLVHKVTYGGEDILSYLPIYNFRAPQVRDTMSKGGKVRLFSDFGTTVVTFDKFPYIYLHNTAGELTAVYEIPGLVQEPYYRYEEDKGGGWRATTTYNDWDYSRISYTTKINSRWLLMRIMEARGITLVAMGEPFDGTHRQTYYAFDVDQKKFYKIGDDKTVPVGASQSIYMINQGLIINDDGKLFLVEL